MNENEVRWAKQLAVVLAFAATVSMEAAAIDRAASNNTKPFQSASFATSCTAANLQAAADKATTRITISEISNLMSGVKLPGGARYFPATDALPAHCQVTGSFVTHPETGKTANFVATFPEVWNGKYLQYGCFGTCGFLALNDATSPLVTIIAQGAPGDSLRKGYASFGTDEGHNSREPASWALRDSGEIDTDAVDDFLYRATAVLATAGKELTKEYYSALSGSPQTIQRAYFNGCSGGGRDALVAASYFPEEFDGIIAGSPAGDLASVSLLAAGVVLAANRSEDSAVSPELAAFVSRIIKDKCDSIDGVKDGLIQNPAACDFLSERDLPKCGGNTVDGQCLTQAQIETVSTYFTAVRNEHGDVVQPGYSVSDFLAPPALEKLAPDVLRVLAFGNPPAFSIESVVKLRESEEGFGVEVSSRNVTTALGATRKGIGSVPDELDTLIEGDSKLLIWHDLSDQLLTPYMSINLYKQLAKRHGGYDRLQKNVRLFTLPGSLHCAGGVGGVGPNSFDALSALEEWVEKGRGPNGLIATHYPGTPIGGKDFNQPPGRTMPLCKFPEMARYKGKGDVNEAASWFCPEGDRSMLKVGESGRRAGVIE